MIHYETSNVKIVIRFLSCELCEEVKYGVIDLDKDFGEVKCDVE